MNYLDSLHWIHERTKFGIKPGVKKNEVDARQIR